MEETGVSWEELVPCAMACLDKVGGAGTRGWGQDIVGGVCISGWELTSLDEAYQTLQDLLCAVKLPGAREQHVLFIL